VPRRARSKPSVRSARRGEAASEGRTWAELPRLLWARLGASARGPSARAREVRSLTFLCGPDARALLSERDCVAAVVPDVVERAAIARRAPVCGDSLYRGEERTRGELRRAGRIALDAILFPPYHTTL